MIPLREGRCFSMCEPDDLSLRDDKLMKPIVVHNGVSPTRFFLYLFPEEPHFNQEEVGEPAFLTPLLKAGKLEEARRRQGLLNYTDVCVTHYGRFCHFLSKNSNNFSYKRCQKLIKSIKIPQIFIINEKEPSLLCKC